MEILKLKNEEIRKALELVWTVFLEFEAPDFSNQGIEEFRHFISYPSIIEQLAKKELFMWGCIADKELTGVIATKGMNHISMLFVKKEYHRRGIARSLFHTVEEKCKSAGNISEITVNSSPYAIEVYHRLGFVDTGKEQIVNGIRFTPMSFSLNK